jgi:hypothetical protein
MTKVDDATVCNGFVALAATSDFLVKKGIATFA